MYTKRFGSSLYSRIHAMAFLETGRLFYYFYYLYLWQQFESNLRSFNSSLLRRQPDYRCGQFPKRRLYQI
jgi:hypothetical protein